MEQNLNNIGELLRLKALVDSDHEESAKDLEMDG